MDTFLIAVITFAATNIDDIFLLMLFFSDPLIQPRFVVIGQYLGFTVLVAVSLVGFLGSFVIPSKWLGLLGLAPIFIGLRKMLHPLSRDESRDALHPPLEQRDQPSRLWSMIHPKVYGVAAITIANGGDNIGIYTPLFANSDSSRLIVIISLFMIMVAVWCLAGYGLARQPHVARALSGAGRIFVPFVLIALGLYILWESGILGGFAGQ